MQEDKMLIVYTDWGECGIYINGQFEGDLPAGCDSIGNLQNFATEDLKFKNIKKIWPGNIESKIREEGWPKTTEFLNEE